MIVRLVLNEIIFSNVYRPSQNTWNVKWTKLIFSFLWLGRSANSFTALSIWSPTSLTPSATLEKSKTLFRPFDILCILTRSVYIISNISNLFLPLTICWICPQTWLLLFPQECNFFCKFSIKDSFWSFTSRNLLLSAVIFCTLSFRRTIWSFKALFEAGSKQIDLIKISDSDVGDNVMLVILWWWQI